MFNIFGKNDWYSVWADSIIWKWNGFDYVTSAYEIIYSKSRLEYKLKISGYKPNSHEKYHEAVYKLNEFIKNGHE